MTQLRAALRVGDARLTEPALFGVGRLLEGHASAQLRFTARTSLTVSTLGAAHCTDVRTHALETESARALAVAHARGSTPERADGRDAGAVDGECRLPHTHLTRSAKAGT